MVACALLALGSGCGGDLETRMREVRALQDVGQYEASVDELREILAIAPNLAEASYRLGVALVQTGESSRAVWSLQKAAEDPEFTVSANTLLATIHLSERNYDEAVGVVDRILAADPDRKSALQMRAKANIGARHFDAALADSERLVELSPDDYTARALYATALLDAGRLDESETAHELLKTLGAENENPELRVRGCIAPAAFAEQQRRNIDRAAELYEDCLARYPDHAFLLKTAAEFFDQHDRRERSTELYREAIESHPENLRMRANLANRLAASGDRDGAESLLLETAEAHESPQAWGLLAGYYRSSKQAEKALAALDRMAELSEGPPSPRLRFLRADLLVDDGQLDRAREVNEGIEEPTYHTLIRGRILMASGDPRGALEAFSAGIENWPNNPAARYLAGLAAREIGEFDRAITELREAVRVEKTATDAAIVLARLYFDRGEYQKALTFASTYLQHRPSSPARDSAYRIAVRSLTALGEYDNARRSATMLGELPGQERIALVELSNVDRTEHGPDAALARLESGEFDPFDEAGIDLLRATVDNQLAARRIDDALATTAAALARRPDAPEVYEIQATVLSRAGRHEDAVRAFERAVEIDPEFASGYAGLATLAAVSGDTERAIELFDKADALSPESVDSAYSAAQLLMNAGDGPAAEQRLRRIVQRSASHAGARNDLAWLLAEKGEDLDTALTLAVQASRSQPSANNLDTLGWVHLKRGDAQRAIRVFERAAALDPESGSIRFHLAEAYVAAGNSEKAREMLQAAVELGAFPEFEVARQKLEQL